MKQMTNRVVTLAALIFQGLFLLNTAFAQTGSAPTNAAPAQLLATQSPAAQTTATSARQQSTATTGRISNVQLQAILAAADAESQQTLSDLLKQAAVVSDALLSIQREAKRHENYARHPLMLEIPALQGRLGKCLQPKTVEDIVEMNELLMACESRGFGTDVSQAHIYSYISKAIEAQKVRQGQIVSAKNSIVEIEKALDSGNLGQVTQLCQRLSTDAPEAHFAQQYLQQTQNLVDSLRQADAELKRKQQEARVRALGKETLQELATLQELIKANPSNEFLTKLQAALVSGEIVGVIPIRLV